MRGPDLRKVEEEVFMKKKWKMRKMEVKIPEVFYSKNKEYKLKIRRKNQ